MHVLLPDFDNYKLIAIQSQLEDYRLAYSINEAIDAKLKRQEEPIYIKNLETSFSVFEDANEHAFFRYHLIQNSFFQEIEYEQEVLFKEYFKKKCFLINEEENIDFILRIEDACKNQVDIIIEKLKNIEEINHLREMEVKDLKSESHLFF